MPNITQTGNGSDFGTQTSIILSCYNSYSWTHNLYIHISYYAFVTEILGLEKSVSEYQEKSVDSRIWGT
jgi:hypothetical protein